MFLVLLAFTPWKTAELGKTFSVPVESLIFATKNSFWKLIIRFFPWNSSNPSMISMPLAKPPVVFLSTSTILNVNKGSVAYARLQPCVNFLGTVTQCFKPHKTNYLSNAEYFCIFMFNYGRKGTSLVFSSIQDSFSQSPSATNRMLYHLYKEFFWV